MQNGSQIQKNRCSRSPPSENPSKYITMHGRYMIIHRIQRRNTQIHEDAPLISMHEEMRTMHEDAHITFQENVRSILCSTNDALCYHRVAHLVDMKRCFIIHLRARKASMGFIAYCQRARNNVYYANDIHRCVLINSSYWD